MKLLFLNPRNPERDVIKRRVLQPLDLAYAAALARGRGHEVEIVDENALELGETALAGMIRAAGADLAVVPTSPMDRWPCPFLDVSPAFDMAALVKRVEPRTLVVLAGPHGTTSPEEMLSRTGPVDVIVRGEPETTVAALAGALGAASGSPVSLVLPNVEGLSFRTAGGVLHTPDRPFVEDLDSLPFPAHDLLPMERYAYREDLFPRPFAMMVSSRGCPFRCVFCFTAMQGKRYRARSPRSVAAEMEWLAGKFGVRSIVFFDLEFALQKERVLGICEEIRRRDLALRWGCEMRVTDADDETLGAMARAGCVLVGYGVESGSQAVLDASRKGIRVAEIERAFDATRLAGIHCELPFFVLGLPGESYETVGETIDLALRLGLASRFPDNMGVAVPYVGTELHRMGIEEGSIAGPGWAAVAAAVGRVANRIPAGDFRTGRVRRKIRRLFHRRRYGAWYWLKPRFYRENGTAIARALKRRIAAGGRAGGSH